MHKISNFSRMTPATFGISRFHQEIPQQPQPLRRPQANSTAAAPPSSEFTLLTLSVNIPFASSLAGPEREDVIHASQEALQRWTFPAGTATGTPIYNLPVHTQNEEQLRALCRFLSEQSKGQVEITVASSEHKSAQAAPTKSPGLVTNVCISGAQDIVHKMRAKLLNETPIMMKSATVEVDPNLILDASLTTIRPSVLSHIDLCASYTGTDIFLLKPRASLDPEFGPSFGESLDSGLALRYRVNIYGDAESVEHAKTRILMMIDQTLKHKIDVVQCQTNVHTILSGRTGKNIKLIEATTKTAIYFPPPFIGVFGYVPPNATRRSQNEIFITGESHERIEQAKHKLRQLIMSINIYKKDVIVSPSKIDSILLDRLDKVRKITEANGSHIIFPSLGSQRGMLTIQGTDVLHMERTVKEVMALVGQFYSASWWLMLPDPTQTPGFRPPSVEDVRLMLSDICMNSGAEVSFEKSAFTVNGSDDTVKQALMVINQIPFVKRYPYQIRVKIELANEHKEFVSGKKNGKINKIMGQSNVQIIFDGFNEYNFYIDVVGSHYEAAKNGLDLVEQEMPASISFHVPDQYHKRIIGIQGQHIQKIMKKYSVFVKFSNAMDRGGIGKEEDDMKVDNVICRTPARNAQCLDMVRQEIMDMVEKADAEYVSEAVVVNRLYHRELISRLSDIEDLEKKWNCKLDFPSTEQASDVITISGPEYQVPQAVDALLGMVPESHEISYQKSEKLDAFLNSTAFSDDLRSRMRNQYEVDVHVNPVLGSLPKSATASVERIVTATEGRLVLTYTRNNAGGLKDVIDDLIQSLVPHGLDATMVKGAIPRPKSDSFEDSLPFFDSKILQNAPSLHISESPTRAAFMDGNHTAGSERSSSILDKFRRPGGISSFSFMRTKNHNNSPGIFFKHASQNASKASLISMESRESGYRNFWNDSGVNLPEEDGSISSVSGTWSSRNRDRENKFPFGTGSLTPGDKTPRHEPRPSFDAGRPPTSHSFSSFAASVQSPHEGPQSQTHLQHYSKKLHHTPSNGSAPNLNFPLRYDK